MFEWSYFTPENAKIKYIHNSKDDVRKMNTHVSLLSQIAETNSQKKIMHITIRINLICNTEPFAPIYLYTLFQFS